MNKHPNKFYRALPENLLPFVSINVMLSELSEANDGILKKKEMPQNSDNYYNNCYGTRYFSKCAYYKAICIKEII